MTHKISREHLFTIYKKVCPEWQEVIAKGLVENTENFIDIPEELLMKGYNLADDDMKTFLRKYFNIQKKLDPIKDIKNFDDILRISGMSLNEVVPWKKPKNKNQVSQNALAKLQLIAEVYNGENVLDWDKDAPKYYNWWQKSGGLWGRDGVHFSHHCACLGHGCYFFSETLAKDASIKFKDIYVEYLPS